jgi:serine/threonine protein kinase
MIGSYEVLDQVGEGGMGVVYRARTKEGVPVAIKVLRRKDPSAFARFERERRLIATLGESVGFVPLLDSGVAPRGPFLVMPFLPGGTLRDRLRRGPLTLDRALALGREVARALAAAHEVGIVHRDVKPENILFTADERPLLADLGLAKHFTEDVPGASRSVSISRSGAVGGTVGYMPAEQMRDATTVGPSADVFALGAVLYECLSGEPAFQGDNEVELATRVDFGSMKSLASLRPDAPGWLVSAVERALAREAPKRLQDGRALLRALEEPVVATGRGLRVAALILSVLALAALVASTLLALVPKPNVARPPEKKPPLATKQDPPIAEPAHTDPGAPITTLTETPPRRRSRLGSRERELFTGPATPAEVASSKDLVAIEDAALSSLLPGVKVRVRSSDRAVLVEPGVGPPVLLRATTDVIDLLSMKPVGDAGVRAIARAARFLVRAAIAPDVFEANAFDESQFHFVTRSTIIDRHRAWGTLFRTETAQGLATVYVLFGDAAEEAPYPRGRDQVERPAPETVMPLVDIYVRRLAAPR